jgi:hypothetical protein
MYSPPITLIAGSPQPHFRLPICRRLRFAAAVIFWHDKQREKPGRALL